MTTSNNLPGYGAAIQGAQSTNGQFLTSNGLNGSSWMSQMPPGITHAQTNAVQIGNPDPVITFKLDGDIVTRAGTITAEDWISVIKLMKRLIMDMSEDQELVSKYPYIQDAAHTWFMNELKGKDDGKSKDE
jgi:hypothetical protein